MYDNRPVDGKIRCVLALVDVYIQAGCGGDRRSHTRNHNRRKLVRSIRYRHGTKRIAGGRLVAFQAWRRDWGREDRPRAQRISDRDRRRHHISRYQDPAPFIAPPTRTESTWHWWRMRQSQVTAASRQGERSTHRNRYLGPEEGTVREPGRAVGHAPPANTVAAARSAASDSYHRRLEEKKAASPATRVIGI